MTKDSRLVWDLPTRLFHWLFVSTLVALYFTGHQGGDPTWMPWHFRLGYFAIGLLLFRVTWGFIGPRHARFVNFLKGPGAILRYMKGGIQAVGHNPMGGWMVVLMLALVSVQVCSGLFISDDIAFAGPYYPDSGQAWITHLAGWLSKIYWAPSGYTADMLHSVHLRNINLILVAVSLHLLAIITYTFFFKEKLVPAMIHGHKDAEHVPASEAIEGNQLGKALIVIAIVACVVWYLVHAAPPPADLSGN